MYVAVLRKVRSSAVEELLDVDGTGQWAFEVSLPRGAKIFDLRFDAPSKIVTKSEM